ncbi:MAG: T9SS type A sorting domain-containing protein [Candidatus Cloacimonadota bacterium]|nr:MAG: T9SS type A sorting domain-containing protein [Candidatus Cloacimonadota bacterium]
MKTKVQLIFSFLLISIALFGKQHSITNEYEEVSFSYAKGDTDEYGYYWLDSNEPGGPIYNWIDITGIGTKVNGLIDDNNVGPFSIGFDFPYYWYKRNQFWVNSNGAISFSDPQVYIPQIFGFYIPNPNPPNDLLIPYGADLIFEGVDTAECYYYTNNVDTFVVSYIKVPGMEMGQPIGTHTFQLILTRQDSCIYFQYGKQYNSYSFLNCAGIEDESGSIGLQVFYWDRPDSGYAVKFIPPDSTIGVDESENRKQKTELEMQLLCHPNPFTTSTTIHLTSIAQSAEGIELKVYDVSGRLVKSVPLTTNHLSLGTDLSPGIYFLKLNGKPVGKVVKVR